MEKYSVTLNHQLVIDCSQLDTRDFMKLCSYAEHYAIKFNWINETICVEIDSTISEIDDELLPIEEGDIPYGFTLHRHGIITEDSPSNEYYLVPNPTDECWEVVNPRTKNSDGVEEINTNLLTAKNQWIILESARQDEKSRDSVKSERQDLIRDMESCFKRLKEVLGL